jgi:predicted nucleic acid-binding protein
MSADRVAYLDASALVRLVVAEPESTALRDHLAERPLIRASCALARVEVPRAVRAHGAQAIARAEQVLERVSLIVLDDVLLRAAARVRGATVRSLDAIHLAAAGAVEDDSRDL